MVGDIALICDDKYIPRNQWRLGKVDKDGKIRGAKSNPIQSNRPMKKLVHFEIDPKSKESAEKEKGEVNEDEVDEVNEDEVDEVNEDEVDEVNEDEVEADKGHKTDIKFTRKAAIE